MKFSVVIPNLNSPIIHKTIDALWRQMDSAYPFEIIVVGIDKPGLVKPSNEVHFIKTDHPVSPGMARSIGARQAVGEILCFVDADCIPCEDWLKRIDVRFQDPKVNVLGGGVECTDRRFWMRCEYLSSFHEYLVSAPAGLREQYPALNLIIRRTVFETAGGFDETLDGGEDSDLTLRLCASGYPVYFDPKIWVDHQPNRVTARAVVRRTRWYAYYSMRVHPRWKDHFRHSFPFRHYALLWLMSPLLASGVTANIYLRDRALWRWWYLAPFIFGLKMIWCFSAVKRLRGQAL